MTTEPVKAYDPNMGSLDDIDDLPEFKAPPSGAYQLLLKDGYVFKSDVNAHPAETFDFTIMAILEQSEVPEVADQVKVGDTFNIAFMMDNSIGQGFFKEMVKPISEKFSVKVASEIRAASKGLQITAVVQRTYDKTKDRYYAKIKGYQID